MSEERINRWGREIASLRRRVNREILLNNVSFSLACILSLLAVCVYMGRRLDWGWIWIFAGACAGCVSLFIWGWLHSRASFFSEKDARAYLDEQMGLHSALSAASELDVPLPSAPQEKRSCLRRKSWSFAYPVGGALLLVLIAMLMPLPEEAKSLPPAVALPPALVQVSEWIDEAEKTPDINSESIEEFQEQMKELMEKSRDEMYSHSGLEAADAMKDKVRNASLELFKNITALNQGMDDLFSSGSPEQKALVQQQLEKALSGLESSKLSLGGELGKQLGNMNPSALNRLTPQQIQQLRERLKKAGDCMNNLCKNALGEALDGEEGMTCMGEFPADGDIYKGGGGAPLSFKTDEGEHLKGTQEKLTSNDMTHASLGDQTGMKTGEHEVNDHPDSSPSSSKAASSAAQGGDAVWLDDLTPQERDAIRGVFK